MPSLDVFLAGENARPFAWGETDCASTADRWVQHIAGISPVALMGAHRTEGEARSRIARCHGGLAGLACRAMRRAGLPRTNDPRAGDVGLVLLAHSRSIALAIRTDRGWWTRDEDGLALLPPHAALRSWRVQPCRKPSPPSARYYRPPAVPLAPGSVR